tara:strand:+ start:310 stop:849 length:540 start_codon:yes stop_codon:yes gene_type:complete
MAYTLKQVGDPNKMNGKREILIYDIYKGSRKVGHAKYSPNTYKSKYNISMYPITFPKVIRDSIIARDGARELTYNYSAGTSAKNPTAVLKQFKERYEGNINSRLSRIKTYKKSVTKQKRSGLSDADYEKLGKLKAYIIQYKDDTNKRLRMIKSEKSTIVSNKNWIKKWSKEISDLKRKK